MRTFVVPDLHGNAPLARALLEEAGVALEPKQRLEDGIRCVQLGDLANCVRASAADDVEVLALALDWFDVVLVGNHELPYFGGGGFSGFHRDAEVGMGIARLERAGILQPCLLVGETLLTHAGVTPNWRLHEPELAMDAINGAWKAQRQSSALLNAVGSLRGGRANYGGVFWSDWEEPRAGFNQVHGHSVRFDGPQVREDLRGHWAVNLDVGGGKGAARLVGLLLDESGDYNSFARDLVEVRSTVAEPA